MVTQVLHTLPQRYLTPPPERPMVIGMADIVLRDTPEDRKAFRIASMIHSASVLEQGRMYGAAEYLRAKAAALKHGVPDGCDSFTEDTEAEIEITP
jgi:hypothetical protein